MFAAIMKAPLKGRVTTVFTVKQGKFPLSACAQLLTFKMPSAKHIGIKILVTEQQYEAGFAFNLVVE